MNWNQFINHQKMWMHSPFTFTIHFFRSELIYESEIVKNHQISICPTLDCVRSTRISKVCLASPTIFGHLYDIFLDFIVNLLRCSDECPKRTGVKKRWFFVRRPTKLHWCSALRHNNRFEDSGCPGMYILRSKELHVYM